MLIRSTSDIQCCTARIPIKTPKFTSSCTVNTLEGDIQGTLLCCWHRPAQKSVVCRVLLLGDQQVVESSWARDSPFQLRSRSCEETLNSHCRSCGAPWNGIQPPTPCAFGTWSPISVGQEALITTTTLIPILSTFGYMYKENWRDSLRILLMRVFCGSFHTSWCLNISRCLHGHIWSEEAEMLERQRASLRNSAFKHCHVPYTCCMLDPSVHGMLKPLIEWLIDE